MTKLNNDEHLIKSEDELSQIYNSDFRNHLDLFQGSNKYIISDPPYNQKYHYSDYSDNLKLNQYGELLQDAFGGYQSVVIHIQKRHLIYYLK